MRRTTMLFVLHFSFLPSADVRVIKPRLRISKSNTTNSEQFQKDCSGEMLNLPQKLTPKCADEKQKLNDAWNRLQAERAKK